MMPYPDILKQIIKLFDCRHLKLQDTRIKKKNLLKLSVMVYTLLLHPFTATTPNCIQAGAVLVRPGCLRLELNRMNVCVACSLLI